MVKLRTFFKQFQLSDYRTSSLYGALIVLTALFVMILMLVQFDPMNLPFKQTHRMPTGDLEIQSK